MNRVIKAICLFLGLAALAACGPVYDTEYTYHPPAGARGQACTASCDADRTGCSYECRRESQDCENEKRMIAEREYNRYANWRRSQNLAVDKSVYDFTPSYSCPWESECTDVCEANYRACFTSCGGRIDAKQVCVMGCEKK
jgi:hypothetical protein